MGTEWDVRKWGGEIARRRMDTAPNEVRVEIRLRAM